MIAADQNVISGVSWVSPRYGPAQKLGVIAGGLLSLILLVFGALGAEAIAPEPSDKGLALPELSRQLDALLSGESEIVTNLAAVAGGAISSIEELNALMLSLQEG